MAVNPFTSSRITGMVQRVRANTKQQIIDLTLEGTARIQSAIAGGLGGEAPFDRFVDGSQGKPLSDVNPNGFTLTRFDLLGHVVDAAIKELIEASPVGPSEGGHYRDDHWLFVNGVRRDANEDGGVIEIKPTDEVVIINMRPYSRKIEGGRGRSASRRGPATARRPGLSVQAPNGVYEITARALMRRFGNIASIRFTYRGMAGATIAAASGPRAIRRGAKGRFISTGGPSAGNASSGRFPAIEISARA